MDLRPRRDTGCLPNRTSVLGWRVRQRLFQQHISSEPDVFSAQHVSRGTDFLPAQHASHEPMVPGPGQWQPQYEGPANLPFGYGYGSGIPGPVNMTNVQSQYQDPEFVQAYHAPGGPMITGHMMPGPMVSEPMPTGPMPTRPMIPGSMVFGPSQWPPQHQHPAGLPIGYGVGYPGPINNTNFQSHSQYPA